jgi:hypothetical protein
MKMGRTPGLGGIGAAALAEGYAQQESRRLNQSLAEAARLARR